MAMLCSIPILVARDTSPALGKLPLVVLLLPASLLHSRDPFVDASERAGIRLMHLNGAKGQKHLPETQIGGAAWLDYDGDGLLDLFIVQGHSDVDNAALPGKEGDVLYRNLGGGRFEDVTARAGVGDRGYGSGAAVGDIDNDGDPDLFVTNLGRDTLLLNRGDGTFTDITDSAGVGCPLWGTSAAFADLDGDGLLDLYVANYIHYDTKVHKACTGNEKKLPGYCHPNKFDGAPDALYRNHGDGRFEDVSKQAGVALWGRILAKGLGVLPTDFDGDGDVDIFVANDSVPNFLWRNLGGWRFEDAALEAGVALDSAGRPQACMGIDGADVNGDGVQDYYITNYADETDALYLGEGDGFFSDGIHRAGLAEATFLPLAFGTRFGDYDLDGDFDLYVACGHVMDNIEVLNPVPGNVYAQKDQLFENNGKGRFGDISAASGAWFQRAYVGRGLASADYDNDGDLDLALVNSRGPVVLLENTAEQSGRHWFGIALEGNGPSNRDAFGSVVRIHTPRGVTVMEVRSAASYQSANDSRLLVGLGESSAPVPRVEVRWPDGLKEEFVKLDADRYHKLVRGTGRALR
jgi:hypothetical protein